MDSILNLNQSVLCDQISPSAEHISCNRETLSGFTLIVSSADAASSRLQGLK
jgi:hypothetical protein